MQAVDVLELFLRAAMFVAVLYTGWLIVRLVGKGARWVYRTARGGLSPEQIARSAGTVSAKVERKASSLSEAFKQGRRD